MANYFYHYTTENALASIFGEEGSSDLHFEKNGFLPIRRCFHLDLLSKMKEDGYDLPERLSDSVSYGFLEPLPDAWLVKEDYNQRSHFDEMIGSITGGDDLALLKVEVKKDEEAYVVDHGVFSDGMEKFLDDPDNEMTYFYNAWQAYWNSRIPLSEYDPQKHPMRRPEVICFSRIPANRVLVIQLINRYQLKHDAAIAAGEEVVPLPQKAKAPDHVFDEIFENDDPMNGIFVKTDPLPDDAPKAVVLPFVKPRIK